MLSESRSGRWRLSLKLESSVCWELDWKCPGGLRAGQVCGGWEADPVLCWRKSRSSGVEGGGSRACLWGEQQTRPCLEEAGCSAKRSYLEILAVRSCVSLLGLCLSRLLSQETRAWEDEKEHKFISRSFGSWKSLRSSYGQFGFSLDLSTWLLMASSSLCPHMVLPLSACTPMSLSLCLSLLF